jgi:hypothetical protein
MTEAGVATFAPRFVFDPDLAGGGVIATGAIGTTAAAATTEDLPFGAGPTLEGGFPPLLGGFEDPGGLLPGVPAGGLLDPVGLPPGGFPPLGFPPVGLPPGGFDPVVGVLPQGWPDVPGGFDPLPE